MALFADGPVPTIEDLVDEDSGLLDVAENTGINVTAKLGLAHTEVAAELELWLNQRHADVITMPGVRICQIVVTPALKRWETMLALSMVYRDAYFGALVDRYQAKWHEYKQLAREARESVIAGGLGMVQSPVPRPEPPVLGTTPGPYPGGTYYVSVAGVNRAGQEGAASWASSITTTDGNAVLVAPAAWDSSVEKYRIYAGRALGGMVRQNAVDVPAGMQFAFLPQEINDGAAPASGQPAEFVRALPRRIQRG